MKTEYTAWEKLSAMVSVLVTFYKPLAKVLFFVSILVILVASFFWFIGYSWGQIASCFIMILIFTVPAIFLAGIVWVSIEDDYRSVLQNRYRK
ncbi:hypothetical protein BAE30_06995 [Acidithiobacillus caldus]|uniref:Uncharacterized protein n=1 Tax=Acidithiobacillus caldus TaxID=33059 RepID=A0A1E7YWV1_9PROT|nr:hypothetical protein BAE30_06995 [Acidithiobacillus caldus]